MEKTKEKAEKKTVVKLSAPAPAPTLEGRIEQALAMEQCRVKDIMTIIRQHADNMRIAGLGQIDSRELKAQARQLESDKKHWM